MDNSAISIWPLIFSSIGAMIALFGDVLVRRWTKRKVFGIVGISIALASLVAGVYDKADISSKNAQKEKQTIELIEKSNTILNKAGIINNDVDSTKTKIDEVTNNTGKLRGQLDIAKQNILKSEFRNKEEVIQHLNEAFVLVTEVDQQNAVLKQQIADLGDHITSFGKETTLEVKELDQNVLKSSNELVMQIKITKESIDKNRDDLQTTFHKELENNSSLLNERIAGLEKALSERTKGIEYINEIKENVAKFDNALIELKASLALRPKIDSLK